MTHTVGDDGPAESRPGRPLRRRIPILTAQIAVAVVPMAFVAIRLKDGWTSASASLRGASVPYLVLACAAAVLSMVCVAWAWGRVLAALGTRVPPLKLNAAYFVGEIGKYVPGWIWAPVGRAELLRRQGVGRAIAYPSVIVALALFVSVGVFATALGAPLVLSGPVVVVISIAVVATIAAAVAGERRVRGWVVRTAARITGVDVASSLPSLGSLARLAAVHVPAWLLIAATMSAAGRALDPMADVGRMAIAGTAAWTAGLLSPVGAGIGAREAVFATASGLDPGTGAAAAVVARLIFVITDAGGALLMLPFIRRGRQVSPHMPEAQE